MSDKAKRDREAEVGDDQYVTIEGIVTSGEVKSNHIILYFGNEPKNSCLIIGNDMIPCRRMELIVDWESPATIANLDCDFVPEEDKL